MLCRAQHPRAGPVPLVQSYGRRLSVYIPCLQSSTYVLEAQIAERVSLSVQGATSTHSTRTVCPAQQQSCGARRQGQRSLSHTAQRMTASTRRRWQLTCGAWMPSRLRARAWAWPCGSWALALSRRYLFRSVLVCSVLVCSVLFSPFVLWRTPYQGGIFFVLFSPFRSVLTFLTVCFYTLSRRYTPCQRGTLCSDLFGSGLFVLFSRDGESRHLFSVHSNGIASEWTVHGSACATLRRHSIKLSMPCAGHCAHREVRADLFSVLFSVHHNGIAFQWNCPWQRLAPPSLN